MFAWIVIRVMKSIDSMQTVEITEEQDLLVCKLDLAILNDVTPIRKVLHEVYSWYWLWHMMANLLIVNGHLVNKNTNEAPGVVIKGDMLVLIYQKLATK
jgi:hypothetical protein